MRLLHLLVAVLMRGTLCNGEAKYSQIAHTNTTHTELPLRKSEFVDVTAHP